jgi:hypothetical protein
VDEIDHLLQESGAAGIRVLSIAEFADPHCQARETLVHIDAR